MAGLCLLVAPSQLRAQGSAVLGNGLSAAAVARGGNIVAERGSALDAVEGNPAALAGLNVPTLDLDAVGLVVGGSFRNAANTNAGLSGVAGVLPFGAFATPLRHGAWTGSAAVTPETLLRANWHYVDAPGTAGVTYGYQRQETQIVAIRSSIGVARSLGAHWSAGVTLGVVYNHNELNAPYIFQQQPVLQGLKVLLSMSASGYGWNGSAGAQWQPTPRLLTGLAWKSGTTLHTVGEASGSASALFAALGVTANPLFHYHAQVMNHLPQAFDGGLAWQTRHHDILSFEGDFTAWEQAFQQLPSTFTQGTNATINSLVGGSSFKDDVPLHWKNQGSFHAGLEMPMFEAFSFRAGYAYASDPVPSSTLTPLTAAIMQNTLAVGGGWSQRRWQYDAAYQVQLPSTRSVGVSALKAGEYNDSRVQVWTQSVTLSTRVRF